MKCVVNLNYMNDEEINIPSPDDVECQIDELPPKVVLRRYRHAMGKMRYKGYTFREIAEFFAKALGVEVNRNQVVYLLTEDPMVIAHENEQDEEEDIQDHYEAMAYSQPIQSTTQPLPPEQPSEPPPAIPPPEKAVRSRKKAKT